MALSVNLTDGSGDSAASAVVYERDREYGLVVYTKERDVLSPKMLSLLNDTYGTSMNQNAASGGTPIEVHNGIDNAYWTGSNITGSKVTFNSTDRPQNGSNSVKIDNPDVNDVWQFDKGSSQDLSNYISISMGVNIDKDWTASDSVEVYGWNTSTGTIVGNVVALEDYIDSATFDVWSTATIPLSDMGLTGQTIYAIRMRQASKNGKAAKFYIDDLKIQETGTPLLYKTDSLPDVPFHAKSIVVSMVDAAAGTLANGAGQLPLSYNQLLGVGELSSGLVLRWVRKGVIETSEVLHNVFDFLKMGFIITNSGSDGTNSFITLQLDFESPIILDGATEFNYIGITVSDNLSGLLEFTTQIRGLQE